MEKITSTLNETVKYVVKLQQKKYREEENLFVAEGMKAIEGLINENFEIKLLFLKEENENLLRNINAQRIILTNDAVLSKISTTKTPCEIIAVAVQKKYNLDEFLNKKRLILLENIKDAGNLGTIVRSCKAFDIDGVILLGDTIDFYNPKVVRATVGCLDIPIINISYEEFLLFKKYNLYATALYKNSVPLNSVEIKAPFIVAFGSEADGLSEKFLSNNLININIETNGKVESLNLASSVSICLYKIFAQTI